MPPVSGPNAFLALGTLWSSLGGADAGMAMCAAATTVVRGAYLLGGCPGDDGLSALTKTLAAVSFRAAGQDSSCTFLRKRWE